MPQFKEIWAKLFILWFDNKNLLEFWVPLYPYDKIVYSFYIKALFL